MPTDTERPPTPYPGAPSDETKQGGLKEDKPTPVPESDDAAADVETGEEQRRGGREGGMIGEG